METLNNLIEFLEDAESKGNAVYIPLDEIRPLIGDLKYLRRHFQQYKELLATQRKVMDRANRIFKRANGWPEYAYPDLSLLFDWLFDHCGKRHIVRLQLALENNLEMLTKVGDAPLLGTIQIDGYIIKFLRENLSRMLSEINDLNAGYAFSFGQPCTYCLDDNEVGDENGQYLEY